jgi:hypothetical protein
VTADVSLQVGALDVALVAAILGTCEGTWAIAVNGAIGVGWRLASLWSLLRRRNWLVRHVLFGILEVNVVVKVLIRMVSVIAM